jgi:flagellar motor switch protein FliG
VSEGRASSVTGPRKVAVLLALLGEDAASVLLRQLGEKEIQIIAEELVTIDSVPSEVAQEVLEEFYHGTTSDGPKAWGGPGYVKGLLVKSFGEETSNNVLRRIAKTAESGGAQFLWMQTVDPQQMAKLLEEEHPQTIALVLAHLDSKTASSVLMRLSEQVRSNAVRRLSRDSKEDRQGSAQENGIAGGAKPPVLFGGQDGGRADESYRSQRRRQHSRSH